MKLIGDVEEATIESLEVAAGGFIVEGAAVHFQQMACGA
jgi:hypothetical protein